MAPQEKSLEKVSAEGNLFWDRGSNFTVIRSAFAEELGLEGTPVTQTLIRTGGDATEWCTKAYNVRLPDKNGQVKIIMAMASEVVSVPVSKVDLAHVKNCFLMSRILRIAWSAHAEK